VAEKSFSKVIVGLMVLALGVKTRQNPALGLLILVTWWGAAAILYAIDRTLRRALRGKGAHRG